MHGIWKQKVFATQVGWKTIGKKNTKRQDKDNARDGEQRQFRDR
jgi:hypothetical protein